MALLSRLLNWSTLGALCWVLSCAWAGAAQAPETLAPSTNGPAPQFAPVGGVFSQPVSVRLSGAPAGAVVRYTLDGSDPTESAETAQKDLRLTVTTLIKARVFTGAHPAGPLVSQTYTLIDAELEKFRANVPVVILNTFGQEILHSQKVLGSIRVLAPTNGSASLTGPADFDGRGELHLRGNSSLRYLKRSYGVKTRDDSGQARAASIVGLPKDSDWILYAPYPDKTLLRDVLAYDLSRQMGHYASRTRFVEVFVNQVGGKLSMRHYAGVFVLEEKIKRAKERVNLQKLGPEDNAEPNITGGYIFKKDHFDTYEEVTPTVEGRPMGFGGNSGQRYGYPTGPGGFPADPNGFLPPVGGRRGNGQERSPENVPFLERFRLALGPDNQGPPPGRGPGGGPGGREDVFFEGGRRGGSPEESFRSSQRNQFFYVEPKAEEITPAQKAWLRKHINEFERVLYGPDFKDPAKGYAAYIDVDSFIDHHLLVEITKNIDGFRFSTFYQKDRGGKIRMMPIWDWNLSFGNANGKQGERPEHWYWPQLDDTQYSYYRRLFEDPDFGQRYVDRWAVVRGSVFSESNLTTRVDALVAQLGDARRRNFQRWPILGRKIWPNTFVGRTYEEEIGYLKDFSRRRLAWMDQQFIAAPVLAESKGKSGAGPALALESKQGQIFFTTDGTDPRASGGEVAAGAKPYSGAITLSGSQRLFARVRHEGRWSPPTRR
jgi:hypothetical protein